MEPEDYSTIFDAKKNRSVEQSVGEKSVGQAQNNYEVISQNIDGNSRHSNISSGLSSKQAEVGFI